VISIIGLCLSHAPVTLLARQRAPIIDMHLHADLPPYDVVPGTPALCRPEPCQGTGQATRNHADTLEKTLQAMDRYNIVKAPRDLARKLTMPGNANDTIYVYATEVKKSGDR
jgi:hypothetical protein